MSQSGPESLGVPRDEYVIDDTLEPESCLGDLESKL